ncbi:Kininogen-1 [Manis pentadactyla]|nr:Kininogen-1 [Manis pentadactyla]
MQPWSCKKPEELWNAVTLVQLALPLPGTHPGSPVLLLHLLRHLTISNMIPVLEMLIGGSEGCTTTWHYGEKEGRTQGYGYQQGYGPGYGSSNDSPHGYYGYSPGYYYRCLGMYNRVGTYGSAGS